MRLKKLHKKTETKPCKLTHRNTLRLHNEILLKTQIKDTQNERRSEKTQQLTETGARDGVSGCGGGALDGLVNRQEQDRNRIQRVDRNWLEE